MCTVPPWTSYVLPWNNTQGWVFVPRFVLQILCLVMCDIMKQCQTSSIHVLMICAHRRSAIYYVDLRLVNCFRIGRSSLLNSFQHHRTPHSHQCAFVNIFLLPTWKALSSPRGYKPFDSTQAAGTLQRVTSWARLIDTRWFAFATTKPESRLGSDGLGWNGNKDYGSIDVRPTLLWWLFAPHFMYNGLYCADRNVTNQLCKQLLQFVP